MLRPLRWDTRSPIVRLVSSTLATATALALSAAPVSSAHTYAPVKPKPKPVPLIQREVRTLVRHGAPGALLVVRTKTGIRRAVAGVAARSPRTTLHATDRWRIASLSKSFVATVVLQLVAEGKLSLDDSIERWLPGLVPNGAAITLHQLLNHTSGLYNYTNDTAWASTVFANPARVWSPRELVGVSTSHPPDFAPGDGWNYSNTGYIVLGLVIEAATGTSLGDQLQQRIFGPLHLDATSFPAGTDFGGSYVHGYIGQGTTGVAGPLVDVSGLLDPSWAWAAGGIVSNGDDIATFYRRLLGGGLLRADLLAQMKTVVPYHDYGLGLVRVDTGCGRAFGHTGDYPGYRTVAIARPNGSRVAVTMVSIDETRVPWDELEVAAIEAYCYG